MTKLVEHTKNPEIWKNISWGNLNVKANGDIDPSVDARDRFAEEHNLKSHFYNTHLSTQLNRLAVRLDHFEGYKKHDGTLLFLCSEYGCLDPRAEGLGFTETPHRVYSDRTTTYFTTVSCAAEWKQWVQAVWILRLVDTMQAEWATGTVQYLPGVSLPHCGEPSRVHTLVLGPGFTGHRDRSIKLLPSFVYDQGFHHPTKAQKYYPKSDNQ